MPDTVVVSTEEFCKQIRDEVVSAGKGIIPLLGAGLSASAGIPTRPDLTLFLKLCIAKALGLNDFSSMSWVPWCPQNGRWPLMHGGWREEAKRGWKCLERVVGLSTADFTERRQRFADLCLEAHGSLADWRLALQFLARLRIADDKMNSTSPSNQSKLRKGFKSDFTDHAERAYQLAQSDVDGHVIDSFFNHIVHGKFPAMGHKMIVNSIQPLRIPLILSLNFDDLLEQAFRDANSALSVFEVHHEAGLPPWHLLGNPIALIKLHGGRYGLRADFTLDKSPTPKDKLHFRGYLAGCALPDEMERQDNQSLPIAQYHLLVAGVSGQDRRVRMLVKDALDNINGIKVFWCCYSDIDQRELDDHFRSWPKQVIGVRHNHLGLFFWELYQAITYCMPSSGLEFPTTWKMPSPPSLTDSEKDTLLIHIQKDRDSASKWLSQKSRHGGLHIKAPAVDSSLSSSRSLSGISALAWRLFEDWNGPNRCIWIDCEDVATVWQLKDHLLQAIAYRVGFDQPKPDIMGFGKDDRHGMFLAEVKELLSTSGRKWILFLNLRGTTAYCADSFSRLFMKDPVGSSAADWIRSRCSQWEWSPEERHRIEDFIGILLKSLRRELAVVVLSDEGAYALDDRSFSCCIAVKPPEGLEYNDWAGARAASAIKWAKDGQSLQEIRRRARLLRAITLFQQVRHHTALVSRAILELSCEPEQWRFAWNETRECVRELVRLRVLRHKAGGFLWMHWEIREHLRYRLISDSALSRHFEDLATLHMAAADWHVTFFQATRDPKAIFQAIYHRCWVAKLGLEKGGDCVEARGALSETANHLELARATILSQGHHHDTRQCLVGYATFLSQSFKEQLDGLAAVSDSRSRKIRQRNLRLLMFLKVQLQLYRATFERDVGNSADVDNSIKLLQTWTKKWPTMPLPHQRSHRTLRTFFTSSWPREALLAQGMADLEFGVLAVSLRKYDLALSRFREIASRQEFPISRLVNLDRDDGVWDLVDRWLSNESPTSSTSDRYVVRRLMFSVMRRYMETLLLLVERDKLLRSFGPTQSRETDDMVLLRKAQLCYLGAQMLPRFLSPRDSNLIRVERSRLHSIMAGTLALSGDHEAVYRQINEAGIGLDNMPESERSIARTVLDLRLIYCKFAEINNCPSFSEVRRELLSEDSSPRPHGFGLEQPKLAAILKDIDIILSRVESRMISGRKSLWWWMTMTRYRMQWIEYLVTVDDGQLLRGGEGVELVTGAETLLKDACLRATYDPFQLARIVYSFCMASRLGANMFGFRLRRSNAVNFSIRRLKEVQRSHDRVEGAREKWVSDFSLRVINIAEGQFPE